MALSNPNGSCISSRLASAVQRFCTHWRCTVTALLWRMKSNPLGAQKSTAAVVKTEKIKINKRSMASWGYDSRPTFSFFWLNICFKRDSEAQVLQTMCEKERVDICFIFVRICCGILICLAVMKRYTDVSWWMCCVTALTVRNLISRRKYIHEENVSYESVMKCTPASFLHFSSAHLNLCTRGIIY